MKKVFILVCFAVMIMVVCMLSMRPVWAQESDVDVQYRTAIFRDYGVSDVCALATEQILNMTPGFFAKYISAQEIRDGILKEFDVVLFPGEPAVGNLNLWGTRGGRSFVLFC